MRKIVIIVGPTAVGKTALALKVAKQHSGILLSADSIQVYKGLDIISGKDKDTLGSIQLKLVDIVSPLIPFSVSEYASYFRSELQNISDKLPIVVGGTGFYISALLNPIETQNVLPNEKLRIELGELSVKELQVNLEQLDAQKLSAMNNSDKNNPRRLMRAIEIAQGAPFLKVENKSIFEDFEICIIGLFADKKLIDARIDERVDERMSRGALKEAKDLFENYETLAPQIKLASGYKQLFEYLQGKSNLETAIKTWKIAEHQNAKKQMTWFRKQMNIEWFDIQQVDFEAKIMNKVEAFLEQ